MPADRRPRIPSPRHVTEAGLVVVDKPQGWTSHQVVGRLRWLLGTRKVGHAGTLDPMATGVLVVGVNRATRLLGHLALHDKDYLATIRLGQATTTDDAEGEPTGGSPACGLDEAAVLDAMAPLTGDIEQVPSAVSAIKVDGQRAYARVRAGENVELASRPVTVTRFDALSFRAEGEFLDVDVAVTCSSGTYVRALARDLGAALGVGGHLTALRRTRVGAFDLDGALPPAQLTDDSAAVAMLSMGAAARRSFPTAEVGGEMEQRVRWGQSVPLALPSDQAALLTPAGELLGLYHQDGAMARPVAVFV